MLSIGIWLYAYLDEGNELDRTMYVKRLYMLYTYSSLSLMLELWVAWNETD